MRDWLGGLPSEWKLRISLVILLLIGSVLLFIFGESLSHAIAEVGIALIIAAILGLTVERALKTDLVQNVFLAAFNYVLPDELKDEVARVINYRFLCRKQVVVIEGTLIDGDNMRISISVERFIYNITHHPEPFRPFVDIDEWGVQSHPSYLDYYMVEMNGNFWDAKRLEDGPGGKLVFKVVPDIMVPRDRYLKITGRWFETRRSNDQICNCSPLCVGLNSGPRR